MTAVAGTINYSGVTTTTAEDVLTFTGFNGQTGGRVRSVVVENRHASNILYVRMDGVAVTAAAGNHVVVIKPGVARELYPEAGGKIAGGLTIRLISSAACDYNVTAVRTP